MLLGLISLGCATVSGHRVKPDDYKTEGIRYWLAMPHLLVRSPTEVYRTETIYQLDPATRELSPLETPDKPPQAQQPQNDASDPTTPKASKSTSALTTKATAAQPSSRSREDDAPGAGHVAPKAPPAKKDDTKGGNDDGDKPEEPAGVAGTFTKPEAPAERSAPESLAEALEIVWLPDYCHQYALSQKAIFAGLKMKVSLADGWKLSSLESEADTTAVIGKVIDLIGTLAKPAEAAAATEKEKPEDSEATPEAEESATPRYLRKTQSRYLKPGLYPLVSRTTCEQPGSISLVAVQYETGEQWSEFAFAPAP